MPTPGPVTLTFAGQQVAGTIIGYDQSGNVWLGEIPPVAYSIDNPEVATSEPRQDGVSTVVTAVDNGVANLTATVSSEGLILTNTETVTVAIESPPAPVLSAIQIAFD